MFTVLPAEGYKGKAPVFPLPDATDRERAVWRKAWKFPQAAQWAKESWRWDTIALWVRCKVRSEESDAPMAVVTSAIRLADQIGLSPAGLKENGWTVARDEVGAKRSTETAAAEAAAVAAEPKKGPPQRRLRAVAGGDG